MHCLYSLYCELTFCAGARGGIVVKSLRYKPEVAGSIPDGIALPLPYIFRALLAQQEQFHSNPGSSEPT
jgi:hypothetical protein